MGFRTETAVYELLRKTGGDFLPDLEAFDSDTRPHDGADVFRRCAEPCHAVYGAVGYSRHGSAPSCMGGRDYAGRGVGEHDRDAISRVYPYKYIGQCRDDGIGIVEGRGVGRQPAYDRDPGAVGLSRHYYAGCFYTGPSGEALAGGFDAGRRVAGIMA